MNRDDWRRWCYRRTAIAHDPDLWVDMHPRLGRLFEMAYDKAEPLREHLRSLAEASYTDRKIQAIRDVYGDRSIEVKYWKHDGSAEEIYADAREKGWTGTKNNVKPYSRRELRTDSLLRWGHVQERMDALDDEGVDLLFENALRARLDRGEL